jgi:spermidine/putrescine transport system permease protein
MMTPLLLVVLFGFGVNRVTNFPMGGLTLDWYRRLFELDYFWPSLANSLIVAAAVGAISTLVGTLAALGLRRLPPRQAGAVLLTVSLPVMLPALLMGIALLSFFVRVLDLPLGLHTVVLGHLVITQPFVVLIVHARLATMDDAAENSARDLGATPLVAFLTVTLPMARTSIVGAALIAAAISLDDFIIAFFTIGSGNTLPTLVWGMVRTSLDPTINAIATILLVLTIGSTLVALYASRYRG